MKRSTLILCLCLLASGCAPRTVIEDAKPTEPQIRLVIVNEPSKTVECRIRVAVQPPETALAENAKVYRDIPLPHDLQDVADEACEEYGIRPDVLYAVMEIESCYKIDAQNGSCYGLMQIHTINMEYLKSAIGTTDLADPVQNIRAGAFILGGYLKKYSLPDSLMAYNLGEGGAKQLWKQGIHETGYTRKVLEAIDTNKV